MSNHSINTIPDIRQTIELNAPVDKVWQSVATSEGIAAWFMPNDFQPALGHEFFLRSPYGDSPCKVTEFDPPNRLAFTWGEDWRVTFELHEQDGKTLFTLVHAGWKDKTENGMHHTVIRERMNQGWKSEVLRRLKETVEA